MREMSKRKQNIGSVSTAAATGARPPPRFHEKTEKTSKRC